MCSNECCCLEPPRDTFSEERHDIRVIEGDDNAYRLPGAGGKFRALATALPG